MNANMAPIIAAATEPLSKEIITLRKALDRIAIPPDPYTSTAHGPGKLICRQCHHWWDPTSEAEHHAANCAYVIALTALK